MSFERPLAGTGPAAEPPMQPSEASTATLTPAMRLQILSTEHWSLLASRSLAWNESFSRAGMFLATLSGAIVALALAAQATEFGEGFRLFALVILPVVLFIGIGTNLRLGISNYHDARCVIGMNRIRAAYVEIAPELQRYFVMGTTDDTPGVQLTMAFLPGTPMVAQMIASTPLLVSALNATLVAAIMAIAVLQFGGTTLLALALGAVGFVVTLVLFTLYANREIKRVIVMNQPLFPGPTTEPAVQTSRQPVEPPRADEADE
jgi:hypothetical protein